MKTYTVHQDGAGNYDIESKNEETALREMAENILDSMVDDDSREVAFCTTDREEQIEKILTTLQIV